MATLSYSERLERWNGFLDIICREPYRIFFPLAIFFGVLGVGHWFFYSAGWIKNYSGFYHSSVQMLVYMNCFVAGFLLTAMSRFTGAPHVSRAELAFFLFFILGMFIFLVQKYWIAAESLFIGWLLVLARFGISRIKKGNQKSAQAPVELIWIPLAVLHGLIGTLMLILSQLRVLPSWAAAVSKPMLEQGFLLSIIIGIGGFLISRLMGTFEESAEVCTVERAAQKKRTSRRNEFLLGAGLFASFWLEGFGKISFAYALRAFIVGLAFTKNNVLFNNPRTPDFFIRLAWVSVWMIVSGLWATSIFPDYRVTFLHFVFIGGFSLMTFSIATMVIMSHAGEGSAMRRPLWILWLVAIGLAMTISKRVLVIWYPDKYFSFLGLAALVWIFVSVCWLCFMAPRIIKVPASDEFERMHEEEKERLKKL